MWKKIKDYLLRHTFTRRAGIIVKAFFRGDVINGIQVAKASTYTNYSKMKVDCDYYISDEQRKFEQSYHFEKNIKFSIVVPIYNTPTLFLSEMIKSALNQTYKNLELILADGSDDEHKSVQKVCKSFARRDRRVKYKKLDDNYGISGNTNECLKMATGDYISLFDHDDLLHPSALFEVMKVICEQDADFIYTDETTFSKVPSDAYYPHYKSDFNPDLLRTNNYICHFTSFSHELMDKVGMFRSQFDGSQDYDLVLRLTEQAKKIVHIKRILYYWRAHKNSTAADIGAKPYIIEAAIGAVSEHLKRVGLEGTVSSARIPSTYRVDYVIKGEPKISIMIPNMDHVDSLKTCLDSLYNKLTYKNFEVIIIENNSKEQSTFDFYKSAQSKYHNIKIVTYESNGVFNYSSINNYGFEFATGEYVLLLNNDVEVISPDLLEQMLMYAQRSDVGAVGAKLYYPDNTVQHAGVILGLNGVAGHSHRYIGREDPGYVGRAILTQNLTAVTAACMMVRSDVYKEIGGFDKEFKVAFNDVDLCMRIRKAGYLIVFNPYAEAYHYESKSRGLDDTPEKRDRFVSEIELFRKRWIKEIEAGDPYYNPNLTLKREDFTPAP